MPSVAQSQRLWTSLGNRLSNEREIHSSEKLPRRVSLANYRPAGLAGVKPKGGFAPVDGMQLNCVARYNFIHGPFINLII